MISLILLYISDIIKRISSYQTVYPIVPAKSCKPDLICLIVISLIPLCISDIIKRISSYQTVYPIVPAKSCKPALICLIVISLIPLYTSDIIKRISSQQTVYPIVPVESCKPALIGMMKQCWCQAPKDRPTFGDIDEVFRKMRAYVLLNSFKPNGLVYPYL